MPEEVSGPSAQPSPSQPARATAYHEAGHAVMAFLKNRPVEKVTIAAAQFQTGGFRLGACKVQKGRLKAAQDAVEDEVLIMLSGMVAESFVTGRYCEAGAAQDLLAVRRLLANRAPTDRQLQRVAQRMLDKTEHTLLEAANRKAVELIAEELMNRETISGRSVRHLMERAARETSS